MKNANVIELFPNRYKTLLLAIDVDRFFSLIDAHIQLVRSVRKEILINDINLVFQLMNSVGTQ